MSSRAGDSASVPPRPGVPSDLAVPRELDAEQWRRILVELQQKLDSMPLIEQAKGILMARFALDADRAFKLLVRWSQVNNLKLRTISDSLADAAGDPAALGRTIAGLQQRTPHATEAGPGRATARTAGSELVVSLVEDDQAIVRQAVSGMSAGPEMLRPRQFGGSTCWSGSR